MSYCFKHDNCHDGEECEYCVSGPQLAIKADSYQVGGAHYKDMPEQPWDAMLRIHGKAAFIGFLQCTILKYEMRDGKKPGALDDAKKAAHYRVKLAEVTE